MADEARDVLPTPKTRKKIRQFRLSDRTLALIDEMAEASGTSRTGVVEHAVLWTYTEWKKREARKESRDEK